MKVGRIKAGSYTVMTDDRLIIGYIDRTGEYGRDDYPWSWYLRPGVEAVPNAAGIIRVSGDTDTKAGAVDAINNACGGVDR